MSPAPGKMLGPYEIVARIGEGGMGKVYRAHDPRMRRDVAIKVSGERFSDRFSRAVHAVAALNHPNICHLCDVGPDYLVMDLVEGPTLAERIKQGAVPLEEALKIARQIADALEAAHEKGIVHRDLKPAHVKIRPDGMVKVLDFGLAKIADTSESGMSTEDSPTRTMDDAATRVGVILGTAAYMSPEQARGKMVDKRADIWAFGVVFYEMVTGRRLFDGEDISEILAKVIQAEPRWDGIPAKNEELLWKSDENKYPSSWSPNGRFLLYSVETQTAKDDIWILPMDGSRKPMLFQGTEFDEEGAQFSPDGKWIAYESDESGRWEVYVREFSLDSDGKREATGRHRISNGGGAKPHWGADGKELIYVSNDRSMVVSSAITDKPLFQPSPAEQIFQLKGVDAYWAAVTGDGKRFLVPVPVAQTGPQQFTVVLNWQAGLKK